MMFEFFLLVIIVAVPYNCKVYIQSDSLLGIINGDDTSEGEAPYQVELIFHFGAREISTTCGGALISERTVMTAAHCTYMIQKKHFKIRYGTNRRYSSLDDIDVETIKMHPEYDYQGMHNDLALLILKKPVILGEDVQIGRLPNTNSKAGTRAKLFGFGWSNLQTRKQPRTMKKTELSLLEEERCRNYAKDLKVNWTERMICGESVKHNSAACHGDSGGPLVHAMEEDYLILGVVSYGSPKCPPGSVTVFTNVFSYLDWIKQEMDKP